MQHVRAYTHKLNFELVTSTLDRVDWNAELIRGDLGQAVQRLISIASS